MKVTHTVTVVATAEDLKAGAVELARQAAQAAAPNIAGGLDIALCTSDLQATGSSTFTFVVTSEPTVAAAPKPA